MKIIITLAAIAFLSGCSNKMALSSWNMGMSMIAPGSYYTAHNTGIEIKQRIQNVRTNTH